MPNEMTLLLLKTHIKHAKASLIRKAKKKGLCENFGRSEARQLSSMAMRIIHDGARDMQERDEASKLINEFEDWAENYHQ
jgi:hypothetical protein